MKYGIHITIALSLIIICPSFLHSRFSQKDEKRLCRVEGKAQRLGIEQKELVVLAELFLSDNNISKEEALECVEFTLDKALLKKYQDHQFKMKQRLALMEHDLIYCFSRLGFISKN